MTSSASSSNVMYVPFLKDPVDRLRAGPSTLLSQSSIVHPVQQIQQLNSPGSSNFSKEMISQMYGSQLAAKMTFEESILSHFHRLPGLPSSHLGLETLMGIDEDITFGDYLNLPENNPSIPMNDPHIILDAKYSTTKAKK